MSDLDLLVTRAESAGVARVYKPNAVPKSPEYPYVVLSLGTGDASTYTLDGSSDTTRRLAAQVFSRTYDGAADVAALLDEAFRDVPLTELPDEPMCNRELASPIYRDPDTDGVLDVLHTYKYGES